MALAHKAYRLHRGGTNNPPLSPPCAALPSLVVYGGDDQTTNQVGGLGDLWVYSPRGGGSRLNKGERYDENDWTVS